MQALNGEQQLGQFTDSGVSDQSLSFSNEIQTISKK